MPAKIEQQPGTVYSPFLYSGTYAQLQKFLMTGVVVAGKVAAIQQKKLDEFLLQLHNYLVAHKNPRANSSPFAQISVVLGQPNGAQKLEQLMRNARLGKYRLNMASFSAMAASAYDLRTCKRDELTKIPGVGMKTASFFILFTRPGARVVCLDTHILAYMRERKLDKDIPKQPRSEKDYLRLEQIFLKYCDKKHPNESVANVDFNIWLARNVGDKHERKRQNTSAPATPGSNPS